MVGIPVPRDQIGFSPRFLLVTIVMFNSAGLAQTKTMIVMSTLRNRVSLIGNLGSNPQFKELNEGNAIARISIATTDTHENKHGEQVKNTEYS